MELMDFIAEVKDMRVRSRSYHVDDQGEYGELVFFTDDLIDWETVLYRNFGPPIKKPQEPVTRELMELTGLFGELFDHQTLYVRKDPQLLVLAMLWPWQDKIHTTLKLIINRETRG